VEAEWPMAAWLCDPCFVPKMLTVIVPAAAQLPTQASSDEDLKSPPALLMSDGGHWFLPW
jgi:hypothetical protein